MAIQNVDVFLRKVIEKNPTREALAYAWRYDDMLVSSNGHVLLVDKMSQDYEGNQTWQYNDDWQAVDVSSHLKAYPPLEEPKSAFPDFTRVIPKMTDMIPIEVQYKDIRQAIALCSAIDSPSIKLEIMPVDNNVYGEFAELHVSRRDTNGNNVSHMIDAKARIDRKMHVNLNIDYFRDALIGVKDIDEDTVTIEIAVKEPHKNPVLVGNRNKRFSVIMPVIP